MQRRSTLAFKAFGDVFSIRIVWLVAIGFSIGFTLVRLAPDDVAIVHASAWYARAALLIAGGIGSLLLHEAAHIAVARHIGRVLGPVQLYPLGGVRQGFGDPGTPRQDIIIALAGPIASLGLAVGLFVTWLGLDWIVAGHASTILYLAILNSAIALFNLLPGHPLDGGQIFRALVWYLHDDYALGTAVSTAYGQLISTAALVTGLVVLGSRSDLAAAGVWIILISWALGRAGREERIRSFLVAAGAHLTAGETVLGLNPHVKADETLDAALETLLAEMHAGPGLVTDSGEVIGVISLDGLRRFRRGDWPRRTVREAMTSIQGLPSVDASMPVRDLLNRLTETGDELLIVRGPDGIVGALDRRIAVQRLFERTRTQERGALNR